MSFKEWLAQPPFILDMILNDIRKEEEIRQAIAKSHNNDRSPAQAHQSRTGLRFIWLGTKGFLETSSVPAREKDSSERLPSQVMVPSGKSRAMRSVMGPSLQTLQHQRKSLAGGPKVSTLSRKAVPASALWSLRSCFFENSSTYASVSGNSSPVFVKRSSGYSDHLPPSGRALGCRQSGASQAHPCPACPGSAPRPFMELATLRKRSAGSA